MSNRNVHIQTALPSWLVTVVIVISILPVILNCFGISFTSAINSQTASYTHTLLDWTAVMIALFTALLSFIYFSVSKDTPALIVGIALASAATIDGLHSLAANNLILFISPTELISPFTWLISRMFYAVILSTGLGILMLDHNARSLTKTSSKTIIITSVGFIAAALIIINYCLTMHHLPQTLFASAFIPRPYELIPLIILIASGILVFQKFYQIHRNPFSHALLISLIPAAAAQLYMAFGSHVLNDNSFNIAHFLKASSYLIPFLGLCLEYINASYRTQSSLIKEIERAETTHLRTSHLFNMSLDLMCIANLNGYFVQLNPQWQKLLGYSLEELLSKPFTDFIHPDDLEATAVEVANLGKPGYETINFENRYRKKDGSYINLLWSASSFPSERLVFAIAKNITQLKENKQRLIKIKEELERSNKELEDFAYVASHDLQEPLKIISSYTELLREMLEEQGVATDAKSEKYFYYITDAVFRMKLLIKGILDYSRVGHDNQIETVDLQAVLNNTITNLSELIREKEAQIKVPAILPVMNGYKIELIQLFQNLINNALKFTSPGIKPEVTIAVKSLANNEWQFSITDNGIGINKQDFEKIFVIFQRLHSQEQYQGTGIGLALCKKVVERHKGRIWVESTEGRGTTFRFILKSLVRSPVNLATV